MSRLIVGCLSWVFMAGGVAMAEPEPARTVRIALVADPHVSMRPEDAAFRENFERVIEEVNREGVDAVLIAGDLTTHGFAAAVSDFRNYAERFDARTWYVPGNHDVGNKPMPDKPSALSDRRIAEYEAALGPSFYEDEIVPGVRLIAANSLLMGTGLAREPEQWAFLEAALKAPSDRFTILMVHYPPFVQTADEDDAYFNVEPKARHRLLDLMTRGGVDVLLAGHTHHPRVNHHAGIKHVIAPAVSFGLPRPTQQEGWTLVTIQPDRSVTSEDRLLERTEAAAPTPAAQPAADGAVADRVHIFYYNWYGAPPHQDRYVHWTQGGHRPPDQIGANYFPQLGAYSSSDPQVLQQHMAWIRQLGAGVLSLTWWGRGSYEDKLALPVLDAAAAAGLKVNFQLEPYPEQTPGSLADDIRYIVDTYGGHPAFYRAADYGDRPMFYVFEAVVRHAAPTWREALATLRGTQYDSLVIAQTSDLDFIVAAGFDGGYTYDGLAPFRQPAMLREWVVRMAPEFRAAGKLFIPSVGPGYVDDRAVPKGADEPPAAVDRDGGKATTYAAAWQAAIDAASPFITITSFNEWHEGSQIEPAVEKVTPEFTYPGYHGGPTQYLDLTAAWVKRYQHARQAAPATGHEQPVVP